MGSSDEDDPSAKQLPGSLRGTITVDGKPLDGVGLVMLYPTSGRYAKRVPKYRVVEQRKRPNKRMFTLNDAGRAELRTFTTRPARPMAIRDDLLVKVHAVDAGDLDAVAASLTARLDQARGKLALYDRLREHLLAGRTEAEYLQGAERVGPYLTLMRGRSFEEENVRWGEAVLAILKRRAQRTTPP